MGKQINQYTKTRTAATIQGDDLLGPDSTEDTGTTFESAKMKVSELLAYINANVDNLYRIDGSLTGSRNVNLDSHTLSFVQGKIRFKSTGGDIPFSLDNSSGVERVKLEYGTTLDSGSLKLSNTAGDFLDANDGTFYFGDQTANYLYQNVNETRQFSNTATFTGYVADRGVAKLALRARSNNTTDISSTFNLGIYTSWGGNFGVAGTLAMAINTLQNVGIGLASTSTAILARLHVKGVGAVPSSSSLLCTDSADLLSFEVQNDGVSVFRSFILASLPSVVAGGQIFVSDATGASLTGSMCFSNGTVWIDSTTGVAVV